MLCAPPLLCAARRPRADPAPCIGCSDVGKPTTTTVFCLTTQGEFTRNLIVQPPASDAVPPASQIREAMVKMLSSPPAVGQPPPQALPARGGPFDQLVPRGGLNASSVGGRQFPKDLSTCVFWSSVGLGALVKGNPVESVRTLHQQFSVSPLFHRKEGSVVRARDEVRVL